MKQGYILLPGLALALTLAGCAGAAHPLGEKQPDLVVYNDSTAIIGSITVSSDRESQGVAMADGSPLERGETLGFWVEHPGPVTVEAFDPEGRSIGRCRGTLGEAQVTVTLEGGRLVWTEAN